MGISSSRPPKSNSYFAIGATSLPSQSGMFLTLSPVNSTAKETYSGKERKPKIFTHDKKFIALKATFGGQKKELIPNLKCNYKTTGHIIILASLLPSMQHKSELIFNCQENKVFKVCGYSEGNMIPASVSTSRPNMPCITWGMEVCIALGVIAHHSRDQKSKVRLYHIFPYNNITNIQEDLKNMKENGYEIQVAFHGGSQNINRANPNRGDQEALKRYEFLKGIMQDLEIQVAIDEVFDNRRQDTPLGVVIEQNGSRFFTAIQLTHK